MNKELFDTLSTQYEVNIAAIVAMAKIIIASGVVNEDNFEIILETAVSHYSSTFHSKDGVDMPGREKASKQKSCEYALNIEIFNNDYHNHTGKIR